MYLSSILNILLVGTATLIASTPNAQCNAAHLRAVSSSAKPSTDEMVYAETEKTWWESSPPKYTSNKESGYGYDHKPGCDHKKPDYHHADHGYGYNHKEPGYNHKDASYGHDSNYAPPPKKYYYPPKSDTKLAEDLEMAATATTSHHCQRGYKKVCHKKCHHHRCHHVCKCVRHWANDDWENELLEMAVRELAEDLEMAATATTSHHCQRGYKKVCHKKCHHHRCHHVCKCVRHWANDDWENELQEMAVHAPTATSRSGKSGKLDNNKKASSFYDYGEDSYSSSSNDDIEESSMIMMQSYDSLNSESGDSIDSDASQDVVSAVF